jgi:S1-C subfamily serine protease
MLTNKLAALALGLSVLVATCGGCVRGLHRSAARRESDARLAAVEVHAHCGENQDYAGSGVVVGPRRVLTAAHVIPCVTGRALVIDARGRVTPVRVEALLPWADLARLVASDPAPFDGLPPARVGPPPEVGQRVCVAPGYPARAWECGPVEVVGEFPPLSLWHRARTEYGNSGGGIFDSRGRLVGIITHKRYEVEGGPSTGGVGTSLGGMESVAGGGVP